jgi:hypothetical protein
MENSLYKLGAPVILDATIKAMSEEDLRTVTNSSGGNDTLVFRMLELGVGTQTVNGVKRLTASNDVQKYIFATEADGKLKGKHAQLMETLREEGEKAKGALLTVSKMTVRLRIPYYWLVPQTDTAGKPIAGKFKRRLDGNGQEIKISQFELVRLDGESGSFEADADAKIRGIMRQAALGGGFVDDSTITLTASGYVVKEGSGAVLEGPHIIDSMPEIA